MNTGSNSIQKLINSLCKLPGIGEKSATRLAFHIINQDTEDALKLSSSIVDVKKNVRLCPICNNFTTRADSCAICSDHKRISGPICIVESPHDLTVIENSLLFKGTYHVLHGVIAPLNGIGPEQIKIKELLSRINNEKASELIFALSSTVEAEATIMYISKLVSGLDIKITKLARGIPVGANIEYIDRLTLSKAFENRQGI
jgi:recombination protein RecR